jgi:PST family polysaccharide transporter
VHTGYTDDRERPSGSHFLEPHVIPEAASAVAEKPMIRKEHLQTDHLQTDHLLHRLRSHAVSGGFAAILARLLTPKDFGLVGMVLAITAVLGQFKELGLSTATVQRETVTQEQVSNLFWINVGLSGLMAVISCIIAPLVAWFYRDSRLIAIMLALSLSFLLSGGAVQHQALLVRQMRFKAVAVIEIASMLVGIITGCCMALQGFAYFSLVGQQLGLAASGLVLVWCTSRWRPSMPKRRSGVRPLLDFGAHLTFANLAGRLAASVDSILIGRFFGAEALGLYSRASVLMARPLEQLMLPVSSVSVPVLSRLQSDPERYRRTFMHAFDTLALVSLPFSAMCFVLAQPLVLLVLGPHWTGAVPLFAGFTLYAASLPLYLTASWLLMSQGRARELLHGYLITGVLSVGAYFLGLPWGPLGVVLALAVVSLVVRLPVLYYLAGREGPVSIADLWNGFLSHLPCWGVVYLVTALAYATVRQASPVTQVLVCGPFGVIAGAAAMFIFRRPRASALYAWNLLRGSLLPQFRSIA